MRETDPPVLVVDDELDIRRLVVINLRKAGYAVLEAASGREALQCVAREPVSMVILDLMLPDISGETVCKTLRESPETAGLPVMMLTAKANVDDRIEGFELGADDYVTKPFSVRELVLRVQALLRRTIDSSSSSMPATQLEFEGLTIDSSAYRVFSGGDEVRLTAIEFRLLHTLASRDGMAQSRGRLLEDVWEASPTLNTRTVDTHVKRLREKMGACARYIETVRGLGYRFRS